jgi:hypothetical protein
MLGEGMVSLGTAVVTADFKNSKASPKIVVSMPTRPLTFRAADVNDVVPSLFLKATCSCSSDLVIPPS